MKKKQYYRLERAYILDMNNNHIPEEKLDWRPVTSWNPFEEIYSTEEEANAACKWYNEISNDFCYRVVKK